jgi:hypothetical protein
MTKSRTIGTAPPQIDVRCAISVSPEAVVPPSTTMS